MAFASGEAFHLEKYNRTFFRHVVSCALCCVGVVSEGNQLLDFDDLGAGTFFLLAPLHVNVKVQIPG
eukprot:m.276588 g.276588  ORF g.276588 m.276588 type:complete len:67 (-) comp15713_c2_seq3:6659-6859(-)